MDITKLTRDATKVHEQLTELADGRLICKKQVKIYIPTRFVDRDMAYIGLENYIVGIYAITVDDTYYGVSLVNAMINIEPTFINRIKIDNEQYFEFVFIAGSTVFKSVNLVKSDMLVYKIYDELLSNGNIPWYMNYEDTGKIFDTAPYHGGANIGTNKEVTELIASLIARDRTDRTKYFRTTVKTVSDVKQMTPVFIGLKSVVYSATNTTNRLGGSYFTQGVVASLNFPATRSERIENILLS